MGPLTNRVGETCANTLGPAGRFGCGKGYSSVPLLYEGASGLWSPESPIRGGACRPT